MVDLHNRIHDEHAYKPDSEPMSWWRDSCAVPQFLYAPLAGDHIYDIAIIGAGVTGLNAALKLAKHHDMRVIVLDSGYPGWGASGRTAGFCALAGSGLDEIALTGKLGAEEAAHFGQCQKQAVDHVDQMIDQLSLSVERQEKGQVIFAHNARQVHKLLERTNYYQQGLGLEAHFCPPEELRERGLHLPKSHGGLFIKAGFGLHPLKYVTGLATASHEAGVRICGKSDVVALSHEANGRVRIHCLEGTVQAKRVLLATNGYASERTPPVMAGRSLPVLSSILVTRSLSEDEKKAQGWHSHIMAQDNKGLPNFFRLLDDGRFLFGQFGGWDSSEAGLEQGEQALRLAFNRTFPAWALVEYDYFWSGLNCLTASGLPYLGPIEQEPNVWAAFGFQGQGLALGSWAGAQMADILAARKRHDSLPLALRQPPKPYPLADFRKSYLRARLAGQAILDQLF